MVLAFIGCWLPMTAVNLAKDFKKEPSFIRHQPYFWPLMAHVIAMSTVIWNPLLFFWLTRKQKRANLGGYLHTSEIVTSLASRVHSLKSLSSGSTTENKFKRRYQQSIDSTTVVSAAIVTKNSSAIHNNNNNTLYISDYYFSANTNNKNNNTTTNNNNSNNNNDNNNNETSLPNRPLLTKYNSNASSSLTNGSDNLCEFDASQTRTSSHGNMQSYAVAKKNLLPNSPML